MSEKANSRRLDYIDSLRGIAIIMVIMVHTSQSNVQISSFTKIITNFGQMGVQLFFVLSALTLCMSLDRVSFSRFELRNFFIRRYFRIAPLYYTGIFFYLIYYSFSVFLETNKIQIASDYNAFNVLANASFIHGFIPVANNNIVPGGWSIGTEMAFYFFFPWLFLLFKKSKISLVSILPIIFLLISGISILTISNYTGLSIEKNSFLYCNLINLLPLFILGITYYFVLQKSGRSLIFNNKYLLVFTFLVSVIISVIHFTYFFHITFTPFLCGISFVLLIELFQHFKLLNNPILVRIGQLSFSMYIFHFVFAWPVSRFINAKLINYLNGELTLFICLLVTITGTALVAMISETFIEKPGINYGRKIIKKYKESRVNIT